MIVLDNLEVNFAFNNFTVEVHDNYIIKISYHTLMGFVDPYYEHITEEFILNESNPIEHLCDILSEYECKLTNEQKHQILNVLNGSHP